jgi:hypothetical protein
MFNIFGYMGKCDIKEMVTNNNSIFVLYDVDYKRWLYLEEIK